MVLVDSFISKKNCEKNYFESYLTSENYLFNSLDFIFQNLKIKSFCILKMNVGKSTNLNKMEEKFFLFT